MNNGPMLIKLPAFSVGQQQNSPLYHTVLITITDYDTGRIKSGMTLFDITLSKNTETHQSDGRRPISLGWRS
jgi:hypothetical protein